jgi:L-ascorbate metabolism protein UlaG (beta-lactamase superfamily)
MKEAITWFGHSSLLLRLDGKTILIDPVFKRASPISFAGPKTFLMKHTPGINNLPKDIDVLLITHDHYDHLEYNTIKTIHKNVKMFYVPLGVKNILTRWGVSKNKIKEFDWYDKSSFENINFIFTPSRHFSGRGLTNINSTLWGGWIIKSKNKNIYVSGDGGYFEEFKKIGLKFGPFDIMFVENGQYNEAWSNIHMFPEQSVQASIICKAKIVMPIHWGKYDLSIHPWKEPIERFVKEAKHKKIKITTPKIGEIFTIKKLPNEKWWANE